ncbi:unnamed protein product [Toxocara canis]|uniref:Mucin-5AC-like n=1 Tax=Toxocara canis TaxID=6265 RepID=A0A183VFE2_TOXCA|nr:unnamed protein product [Toxocara canis]
MTTLKKSIPTTLNLVSASHLSTNDGVDLHFTRDSGDVLNATHTTTQQLDTFNDNSTTMLPDYVPQLENLLENFTLDNATESSQKTTITITPANITIVDKKSASVGSGWEKGILKGDDFFLHDTIHSSHEHDKEKPILSTDLQEETSHTTTNVADEDVKFTLEDVVDVTGSKEPDERLRSQRPESERNESTIASEEAQPQNVTISESMNATHVATFAIPRITSAPKTSQPITRGIRKSTVRRKTRRPKPRRTKTPRTRTTAARSAAITATTISISETSTATSTTSSTESTSTIVAKTSTTTRAKVRRTTTTTAIRRMKRPRTRKPYDPFKGKR